MEFVKVFGRDAFVYERSGIGVQLYSGVFERVDDVAHHEFSEKRFVIHHVRIDEDLFVGLSFYPHEGVVNVAFPARKPPAFEHPFMEPCELRIVPVFHAEKGVLTVELGYPVVNARQGGDVLPHFLLRHFVEVLLIEKTFELVVKRDELRVFLIEVPSQSFPRLPQHVFQLIGKHELFFGNLPEHEKDAFQCDVQEVFGVGFLFYGFFKIEKVEMTADFVVQDSELLEVELFKKFVMSVQTDDVVQVLGIFKRLLYVERYGFVLNLAYLLGKDFGIFDIVPEKLFPYVADLPFQFVFGCEKVRIRFHFVAEFLLEFVEVSLVGRVEFFSYVGEIDDETVSEGFVWTIYPRQRLKEVVIFDDAPEVKLFKAFGIEARQKHVVHEKQVDFSFFEILDVALPIVGGSDVVKY